METPTLLLNNNQKIPLIGLGTSHLGEQTYETIVDAIEVGYRHFNSAFAYNTPRFGGSSEVEKEIGRALKHVFSTTNITRSDVWITSKVWNNRHTRNGAFGSIKRSLQYLNTSYLDLIFIHFPMAYIETENIYDIDPKDSNGHLIFDHIDYLETYKGLEDAFNEGLVKTIGLSNFNHKQIERVMKNSIIKPAILEIESHAYLTQKPLIEYCHMNNIQVIAFSPLGHGTGDILKDPKLMKIAENHKKSVPQILLKYQIQRNVIVIPKTKNKTHLSENINIFDFELTNDEIESIESLNKNKRFITSNESKDSEFYPFNDPY